jgi:probable rRNA maturation factor
MTLHYRWNNRRLPNPNRSKLRRFVAAAADLAKIPAPCDDWFIEINFIGDRTMSRLNREIVGHIGTTDVITMCYFDDCDSFFAGDTGIELYINADIALREGAVHGTKYAGEMALYIVHGLLHSAGEDDLNEKDRKSMRRREKEVISALEKLFDFNEVFNSANVD